MTVRPFVKENIHKFLGDLRSPLFFFLPVDFYYTETNFSLDKHPRGFGRFNSLNSSKTSAKEYTSRRFVKMYALQTFCETMRISWADCVATLAGRPFRLGKISKLRRTITLILTKLQKCYSNNQSLLSRNKLLFTLSYS